MKTKEWNSGPFQSLTDDEMRRVDGGAIPVIVWGVIAAIGTIATIGVAHGVTEVASGKYDCTCETDANAVTPVASDSTRIN